MNDENVKPAVKHKRNRELLEEAFPVEYIKQGLNGTRAYKAIKQRQGIVMADDSARAMASQTLSKLSVQERIRALLPSEEVEAGVIRDALLSKPKHAITFGEKHKYLETSLKLKGLLKTSDDKPSVQVGIIIER